MKKISIALGISLILVMVVVSSGLAALPGTGWWSALWVQNISGGDGQVSMIAYDNKSASTYDSLTFDFGASKALVYDPGKAVNYPTGNRIGLVVRYPPVLREQLFYLLMYHQPACLKLRTMQMVRLVEQVLQPQCIRVSVRTYCPILY
jgi:hypothetical protein